MGVVSGGACAERRMCRHLVAPSFENQFFSDSRAFLTLVWYYLCIVLLPYLFCIHTYNKNAQIFTEKVSQKHDTEMVPKNRVKNARESEKN